MACPYTGGKNTGKKLIIRRVQRDVDGNLEATLVLSPEQAGYLINFAIGSLVATGMAVVQTMTEEEFKAEAEQNGAAEGDGNSEVTYPAVDISKLN